MSKLTTALDHLRAWQRRNPRRKGGLCLGTIRTQALAPVGLKLPWLAWPRNTAWYNFQALAANPGKWGWRRSARDVTTGGLLTPVLVYFKDGKDRKRKLGHIGILYGDVIYSDVNYTMDAHWAGRLVGAYEPID